MRLTFAVSRLIQHHWVPLRTPVIWIANGAGLWPFCHPPARVRGCSHSDRPLASLPFPPPIPSSHSPLSRSSSPPQLSLSIQVLSNRPPPPAPFSPPEQPVQSPRLEPSIGDTASSLSVPCWRGEDRRTQRHWGTPGSPVTIRKWNLKGSPLTKDWEGVVSPI